MNLPRVIVFVLAMPAFMPGHRPLPEIVVTATRSTYQMEGEVIAVWDRALTADEVRELWSARTLRFP